MPYDSWLRSNAPTWMQDADGQAWMGGIGSAMDDYVQLYVAGMLAQFPDYAPSDALGVLGDEMGIDRGPTETDANYAARLTAAWQAWRFAGAPAGLLVALYWSGFSGAVIVQQNGLAWQLNGTPTPTSDFSTLITVTSLIPLASVLTSNVTPPTALSLGRSIPSANPWWTIDNNTDFTSRFEILFPGGTLPSVFNNLGNTGRAVFTASDTATLTWFSPIATPYLLTTGPAIVTDGGGPVSAFADSSTETTTGVTVRASSPFTGYVDCATFGLSAFDAARLQGVIRKWKPAKATCTAVRALLQGQFFGWPVQTWGTRSSWGPFFAMVYQGA